MRQIKYQAWIIPLNRWADKINMSFEADGSPDSIFAYVHDDEICWKGPAVVLRQFTGLLDKNGTEIYEGDIVSFPERPDDMQPFVMRWDEMRRGWAFFSPQRAYEVIGNIHENPELLKC